MRLLSIQIEGFGTHGDGTEINLSHVGRMTAVTGPNQTGKTWLFSGVIACLYGDFPGRSGTLYDHLTHGHDEGRITVRFEDKGVTYRTERTIRRTAKTTSSTATLINESDPDTILAGPRIKDYEAAVETLIGSRGLALATWFKAQGQEGDLVSAVRGARRDGFAEFLRLSRFQDRADKFTALAVKTEGRIKELAFSIGDTDGIRQSIGSAEEDRERLVAKRDSAGRDADSRATGVEYWERNVADAESTMEAIRAREEAQRNLRAWEAGLSASEAQVSAAGSMVETLSVPVPGAGPDAEVRAAGLSAAEEALAKAIGHNDKASRLTAEHDGMIRDIRAEAKRERTRAADLRARAAKTPETPGEPDVCARCPLMKDVAGLADQAAAAEKAAEAFDARAESAAAGWTPPDLIDLSPLHEAVADARAAGRAVKDAAKAESERLGRLDLAERNLSDAHAKLTAHRAAKPAVDPDPNIEADRDRAAVNLASAKDALADARRASKTSSASLAEVQATIAGIDGRLSELRATLATMDSRRAEHDALVPKAERLRLLARIWGKDGIQPLLIEHAAPEIEALANQILARIGSSMTLRIDTLATNRDGSTREDFRIMVRRGGGIAEVDASVESGGGKRIVSTALSAAICIYAARTHGFRAETLMIDEAFDALDAANQIGMADAIRSLSEDFAQVLAITHSPELSARFDSRVSLSPRMGGVTVEIS